MKKVTLLPFIALLCCLAPSCAPNRPRTEPAIIKSLPKKPDDTINAGTHWASIYGSAVKFTPKYANFRPADVFVQDVDGNEWLDTVWLQNRPVDPWQFYQNLAMPPGATADPNTLDPAAAFTWLGNAENALKKARKRKQPAPEKTEEDSSPWFRTYQPT